MPLRVGRVKKSVAKIGCEGMVKPMDEKKRVSLWAACLQIGGYPELLLNLAQQLGLEVSIIGRARYVNRADLGRLEEGMKAWLKRPRMSRRIKSAARSAHPAAGAHAMSERATKGQ